MSPFLDQITPGIAAGGRYGSAGSHFTWIMNVILECTYVLLPFLLILVSRLKSTLLLVGSALLFQCFTEHL
jgi:hypothetical protein